MEQLTNKKDRITFTTNDIEKMHHMYVDRAVYRQWDEDYFDTFTKKMEVAKREEIVVDRGEWIDGDIEARISFHLQCGDIKAVKVTNQKRLAREAGQGWTLWDAKVDVWGPKDKSMTVLLYAKNLNTCVAILTDYLEQITVGSFSIRSLKSSDAVEIFADKCPYSDIAKDMERAYAKGDVSIENHNKWSMPAVLGEDVEAHKGSPRAYYKISFNCTEIDSDNPNDRETNLRTYIVATYSAARAADLVNEWMRQEDAKAGNHLEHHMAVEFSKLITVTDLVPMEFSKKIIKDLELTEQVIENATI